MDWHPITGSFTWRMPWLWQERGSDSMGLAGHRILYPFSQMTYEVISDSFSLESKIHSGTSFVFAFSMVTHINPFHLRFSTNFLNEKALVASINCREFVPWTFSKSDHISHNLLSRLPGLGPQNVSPLKAFVYSYETLCPHWDRPSVFILTNIYNITSYS